MLEGRRRRSARVSAQEIGQCQPPDHARFLARAMRRLTEGGEYKSSSIKKWGSRSARLRLASRSMAPMNGPGAPVSLTAKSSARVSTRPGPPLVTGGGAAGGGGGPGAPAPPPPGGGRAIGDPERRKRGRALDGESAPDIARDVVAELVGEPDRKSTRLNSTHR